jgi:hypothetical protein
MSSNQDGHTTEFRNYQQLGLNEEQLIGINIFWVTFLLRVRVIQPSLINKCKVCLLLFHLSHGINLKRGHGWRKNF